MLLHLSPTLTNALRSFIYTSLLLHLGTMVSAAFSLTMLSDLPSYARKIAIQDPESLPAKAMYEEDHAATLSSGIGDTTLLRRFGLGRTWECMKGHMIICFVVGCFCSFITIGLWVWSVEALRAGRHSCICTTWPHCPSAVCGLSFTLSWPIESLCTYKSLLI